MKRNFVRGNTTAEKFTCIEKVLQKFSRRLHKTILGVVPPAPISSYTEDVGEDGLITRFMFPGAGKVTKGCMFVEEYVDKKTVEFFVQVLGASGGRSFKFSTRKALTIIEPNLDVDVGDRLVITTEVPARAKRIWVGFLYEFAVGDMYKQPLLIGQFEKLIEGGFRDASESEEG